MGDWVIDVPRKLIHRASRATPACALDALAPGERQERDTELEAMLVMKTRHYLPCPHCHA